MRAEVCWLQLAPKSALLERSQFVFDLMSHMDIHVLRETAALIQTQHCQTRGGFLTRVKGDVSVASSRRLSVAVALSSPQADTQILSRISLAQCLMVHQYQVQCDTEASVCAPSSQLLSTVSRPSVTKCHAVTPVLEHYPQRIYDLNEPTSFLLSINNWAATEGVLSTAIWRGTRVVGFTQRVIRHIGEICLTEYSPGSEIFLSFSFFFFLSVFSRARNTTTANKWSQPF